MSRGAASALRVPTLLLHGDQDRIADVADSRAFQAGCVELRVIEGAAHDLLHERASEKLAAEIAVWLQAQVSGAR